MEAKTKDPSYIHIFGKKIHRAWLILVGCCFLQAGALGNILTSASPFYVAVCSDLGFLRSQFSLYITMNFLFGIAGYPIAGQLLNKVDTRIVMSAAVIIVAGATMAMGTYTELWQWWISGALYGLAGSALFMVPYSSMISNWFMKKSGIAMGIAAACAAMTGAIMVPAYTALIAALGWRTTYFIQGLVLIVLVLPWALFVFRIKPQDMNALPYGWSEDAIDETGNVKIGPGVPFKRGLLSIAFVCCLLFAGVSSLIGSGFDGHLPGHIISLGYDAMFGAFVASAMQLGSFCDKLCMGWLNDKFGIRNTIWIELGATAIGILLLVNFRIEFALIAGAFLFGVTDSLLAVSAPQILKSVFGEKDYVRLYAWMSIGVSIVSSFGQVLVGLSYDMTGMYTIAWYVALAFVVVLALLTIGAFHFGKKLEWED